jgi:hypothetical protein
MSKVKNYYSVSDLAFKLKKSRQQISLDCRLGKIKSRKFGRSYFIHQKTVDKLLDTMLLKKSKKTTE